MNMKEVLKYKEDLKKSRAQEYLAEIAKNGECTKLTEKEYKSIETGMKSSTTRKSGFYKQTFISRIKL